MTSGYKLIILALVVGLVYPALASGEPAAYRVFVDDSYGFRRVIELNYTPFEYKDLTLNINVSDAVTWVNDADNESLTIVSGQNLWDNKSGYLRYVRDSFKYTFVQPGTYDVYIKERPRVRHQTIVVAAAETPTPTATPTETPTATPTATVVETTAQAPSPAVNLWYILIIVLVIAGIVLLWYFGKKG